MTTATTTTTTTTTNLPEDPPVALSRRECRRQQTIDEILDLSLEVMREEGVGGLRLTAVAKRLGVHATAIYKYFPSLIGVYDALFHRAVDSLFSEVTVSLSAADPGLASVRAAVSSASHWAVQNPELTQLLIWRPVPGYRVPSVALTPGAVLEELFDKALKDAADAGEIGPAFASLGGPHILSILVTGAACLYFAEYGSPQTPDDFVEYVPGLVDLLVAGFPPSPLTTEK